MSQMQTPRNTESMVPKTQPAAAAPATTTPAKQGLAGIFNALIDAEGYRRRFDELLGKRTPQFISALVSLVNATPELQKVAAQAPITIIQAALKAATFDLPIDPALGYAYIMPFNNTRKLENGQSEKRYEAAFVLGYKGMIQLALRTGAYKKINVSDVRQGELRSFDRLREDIDIQFIEDEEERDRLPIVGWVGYFRLVNGAEKIVYMSRKQMAAHELRNRKGQYMSKGWRDNFNGMAAKTVIRQLIGKWGLMSIDYQRADASTLEAAEAIAEGTFDDVPLNIDPDAVIDEPVERVQTGEVPESVRGITPPFE